MVLVKLFCLCLFIPHIHIKHLRITIRRASSTCPALSASHHHIGVNRALLYHISTPLKSNVDYRHDRNATLGTVIDQSDLNTAEVIADINATQLKTGPLMCNIK